LGATTFLVTSLLFPVATTWGTFLHAAGPVHVLLVISALGAMDGALARLARRMGWTREVAWTGAVLAVGGSLLFSAALLPTVANGARETALTYRVLAREMAAIGAPLDGSAPVIHDFPIWLAETQRVPALALPDEAPGDVLDLASEFGAAWLIIARGDHGDWPEVLDRSTDAAAACFTEVRLGTPDDPAEARAIEDVRVWHIACNDAAASVTRDAAARPSPQAR
jgi:hypothetical protein